MPVEPRRPSIRWLTMPLIVAASMYAWYAFSQYQRLNDLNQRQLSNVGAELKTALDNGAETVRQFNAKWNKFAAAPAARDARYGPDPQHEDRPNVCDFVKSQPYLDLASCTSSRSSGPVEWHASTGVLWATEPSLGIAVQSGENTVDRFRYRLDRLLQELAFPDSAELVFIATEKGDVLYQDAPLRRRWLRHLRWGDRTFRDASADRPSAMQVYNVLQVVGGAEAWTRLRAVSSRVTVDLGGSPHQLYLQPLVLDSGSSATTLVVGSAVPRGAVVRDALALGTSALGVLVFLVLAGALGFPFVKLSCLDMHERFGLRDVKLLYVSSGALLVLFTCAAFAYDGYTRWRLEADRGLEPFAEHLEQRVIDEVRAIRDEVVRYDDAVAKLDVQSCERWAVDTNWFASDAPRSLGWPEDAHLKTVAWIEPGGQQIWKSTFDAVPGKLHVGRRMYFRAVRDGNLFQVEGEGPPFFLTADRSINDGKFYTFLSMPSRISPSMCATTGPADAAAAGTAVVASTAQLLSLDRQPLPAGYGFALVNREGRVLYHSDGRLSLRENLYEELSEGDRARAMTYAGRSGGLDTRYRERPHRLHLQPLRLSRAVPIGEQHGVDVTAPHNDAGFYLAVFRDTSVEQALVGHVFVVGLAGPMLLLALLTGAGLALIALVARRQGHCWSVWLWPHQGLNHIYQRQSAALLALMFVSTILFFVLDSVTPFLLMPFVATGLALGIYWFGVPQAVERGALATSGWQTLSVFLFLLCAIVVPSSALFRVALNQEFAKLIVTERDWIQTQTDDWFQAAGVESLQERYAPARIRQVLNARALYRNCVPAPFVAPAPTYLAPVEIAPKAEVLPAALEKSPDAIRRSPDECGRATAVASVSAPPSLRPIGLVAGVVDLLHGFDFVLPVENDILARRLFQGQGQAYSPDGTIVRRFRAAGTTILGLAVLFAALSWWIRWNTRHLFLADLAPAGKPPAESHASIWSRCSPDEQMVLVQIARERIANPYQRSIVQRLLARGLVRFNPELQPYSKSFDSFLHEKEQALNDQVKEWHDVEALHSWRHGRLILAGSVAALAFFLMATQPGLQSSVMALATGVTGLLTAGSKLQEAISSWFARKGSQ